MAQKAKLVMTFNEEAKVGEDISFYRVKSDTLESIRMRSFFVIDRRNRFELRILNPSVPTGQSAAIEYQRRFGDHNSSGIMSLVRGQNVITIEIEEGWFFDVFASNAGVTFEYFGPVKSNFELEDVSLVPSTDPCETFQVKIETSSQAGSYRLNGAQPVAVTTNPFLVEADRAIPNKIIVQRPGETDINVSRKKWNEDHIYINKLLSGNVNVNIVGNVSNGSTVSVNVTYPNQLTQRPRLSPPLQYSLSGNSWSPTAVFNGQSAGSYTMHVKDFLGCIVEKDYFISADFGKNERPEYFYMSDLNSIGVAENEVWDGNQNGIEKNPENVLAESDRQDFLYDERLIYRQDDSVRLQFKSNYDLNEVTITPCENDNQFKPVVEKMSNNLNLFESLEAKMYSYGDGSQTAIYFDDGVVYSRTGVTIGDYELNGNLPDSAIIGNLIEIQASSGGVGGIHEIRDILFDSEIGKKIIVFNYDCQSVYPVDVVIRASYDLLNYEVYEFEFEFIDVLALVLSSRPDTIFRLQIKASDELYGERNFFSDWITIIPKAREYDINKYFAINYSNNNNRSVFYLYGITHFIRAEVLSSHTIIDDEVESTKGDLSTYLTKSVVHQGISITFEDVTHKVLMKYILALSSENVFINGLGYKKEGPVEIEPVPNTNLYSLTVTMLRDTQNFNAFISGRTGLSEGYQSMYIPKLITTNLGGSIKI